MIRELAAKNGLIKSTFHIGFLSQEFRNAETAHPKINKHIDVEAQKRCGKKEACKLLQIGQNPHPRIREARQTPSRVDWTTIIDHIYDFTP